MKANLEAWMANTSTVMKGLGSKVLLWTNPSPTAAFGAQTVISNTDLTIYDEIEIYYAGNNGYPDCTRVAKQPANTNSYIFGSSNSLTARNVVITGTSLSFGNGIRYAYDGNGTDDNYQLIPQKIYGVNIGATGGGGSGGGTSDYEELENKPSINGVTLVGNKTAKDLLLSDAGHEELTQAEYDVLTPEEKNNGTVYFVPEGNSEQAVVFDLIPIGSIQAYGGSTAPSGWLICDGSAVSRTAYAELFAVIGTTYGSGDGATTFNVPNLNGKVAIGSGANYILGSNGGEETHTLTVNEMPSHTHKTQGIAYQTQSYSTNPLNYVLADLDNSYRTEFMMPAGGGQAHNNMQPYVVTNYIIKATDTTTFSVAHPIGSYFETSDSSFNPNNEWGGTWVSETRTDDCIVEEGTATSSGAAWTYRKWSSGIAECWGSWSGSLTHYSTSFGGYAFYTTVNFPEGLFISGPIVTYSGQVDSSFALTGSQLTFNKDYTNCYAISGASGTQQVNFYLMCNGRWKNDTAPTVYKWHRTA